ncbi:MAG: hypothetical protein ABJB04_08735, partial [Betaproteobacteria bacterium]
CFTRADALQPNVANLQMNVGSVLVELGLADEALPHFDAALSSEPGHPEAEAQRLYASQLICRWAGFDRMVEARLARVRSADPPSVSPFTLLSIPATPEDQYRAACAYAATIRRVDVRTPPVTEWTRGQRLRIGYLSSDLRRHPVGSVLSELLELHDRSRVEVFAYAHGPHDSGPERERLMRAVDHWRDVTADSDEQIIRHIRADGIHLLIDLNGYTQHERKEIAASRPAPVQISFLGYPGSCGGDAYDFVLTDRFVCPPEQQRNFSERFLYMPHCVMPADTTRAIRDQSERRAAYGLPEQGFVFCAFTNPVKIIPPLFDLWMRLLREIPESVLWLRSSKPAEENLRYEARQRGVPPERIVFAQHCADLAEHLARQRLADLFLDTLPYGAHSTASDALYAGLPVLTCAGDTFAGRVAGSQLHTIGLPELVTPSLPSYEALALRLAREPGLLAGLRARLATNRGTGPLFDMARYARAFEDRLEEAWAVCAAGGTLRAAALNADT